MGMMGDGGDSELEDEALEAMLLAEESKQVSLCFDVCMCVHECV